MVSVDKQALISQLCTASKLQGKDLEEYRARLNKMSETELSALISGDNKGENVDTVELNHSQGVNKTEITKKDAEDSAIQTIESNANQAIQMIDSQDDGNISEAYNKLKEKFDSDLAKSNVEKIVYKQLETAYFLKEAQANNLTYREYFEQRKELLYKTFPGIERFNDKQKQSLKRMIDSLSPEQVLEQQDKILSLPEAGTEGYDDSVRSFLNDFKTETTDSVIVQNKEFGMKVKTKPKDKFELADGERLMTFDEVYYLEQDVNFNKDNIQKYNESAGQFAFVNSVNQKREEVHKILEEPLKLVKGNNALGANPDVINSSNKQLNTAVYSALAKLYGNDEGKIKQGLKELTGENYSFKNGELVLEDSKFKFNTDTILPNIAQTILDKIDSNYEKMTNGKSLEDYAKQMAEDYKSTYGSKDATNLASAYVQDQEGMVQNIRTGVELVGAGVMVAGMIFFPPAALAGGAVAGFGGAGVELYNESTRDNVNTERTGELKKELVINSLLMVVGMGAGKAGSAMKAVLTAKNAPKLAAIAGDIGTDATISLLGDLALTGQVNIEGEGFAQFLSLVAGHKGKIVSGIKHVKDNIKAKFGPDARQMPDGTIYKVNQDGSTTVLRDVVETPGVNDGAGISHTTTDTPAGQSDLSARLDNAQSREDFIAIRDEIKNMPNSAEKTALVQKYQQKYREFSTAPERPDIRMEYKPEDKMGSNIKTLSFNDIFSNKTVISNQEANNILRQYGLSEADIAELRNNINNNDNFNATVNAMEIVTLFDDDFNLNKMKVNEIKESLTAIANSGEIDIYKVFNNSNMQFIQERLNITNKTDAAKILYNLLSKYIDKPELAQGAFDKSVELFDSTGVPFKDLYEKISQEWYPEDISKYTPERVIASKQFSEALGIEDYLKYITSIDDPSQFTPEFINEFKTEYNALKKLNIEHDLNYFDQPPVEILNEFKTINEFCKKYGFDFSELKKSISRAEINKILALDNPLKAKNFLDNLSPEFKDKYQYNAINMAADKNILNSPEGYIDFCNEYAKIKSFENLGYRANSPQNFINELKQLGVTDFSGVSKLINAFNEVGHFPAWSRFFSDFKLTNGDYEEAAKFIKKLPEILDGESYSGGMRNSVDNYITYSWDPKIDFKTANARIKELEDKNLLSTLGQDNLRLIAGAKGSDIVDKYELLNDYGISYDSAIHDILNNENVSIKDIQDKIDILGTEIQKANSSGNNIYDKKFLLRLYNARTRDQYLIAGMVNNGWNTNNYGSYFKLDDDLDIKYELYNKYNAEMNNKKSMVALLEVNKENLPLADKLFARPDFPKEHIADIVRATNEQNIKLAEDLCNNPDFPKEHIADIVRVTNEQNIKLAEDLCNRPDFPKEHIADIVQATREQNIKLAEQLCRDKNLSKDSIPNILFSVEGIEKPFAYLYENDSVFKDYTINHGMFGNLQLAVSFWDLNNKTSISELSKVEKKKVLLNLLANKNNLKNNDLRDIIPLLPQNDTEYANLIKSITQSLNMSFKPLDAAQQKEFNTSLNNLTNSLRTMDLSNLTEVNLTMPHTEFIKQVQDIMKDLPIEEQAKIQDYFGFKIDNGRLTGYPNSDGKELSLSGITDEKSLTALDKVKNVVDNYTDNNFVTVKDNPILNQQLKDISKYMPEIFNQIDGSGLAVSTIKSLQKVVQNPKFDTLSDSDKKVMVLSTLLHNTDKVSGSTSESAFDAYFISQRFGVSDIKAQKIYKIVESSDLIDKFMSTTKTADNPNERKNVFDLLAFNLKEGNDFELAQMLYSSKEQDGLTRYLDKALEKRMNEIKSNDFMLPQTSQNEYFAHAKDEVIEKGGVQYNVKVVSSSDIDNFYALVHTPDAGFTSGGSRMANFANFEIFKDFADDKVVCAGYIGNDQAGLVNEFHKGFIFEVPNDKQYVGYGTDIWSNARNIPAMIADYYRDNGQYAYHGRGERFDHRTMISNELKSLLYKPDEADIDKKYAARLENIKNQLGTETMTLARLQEIDPEFANAYKEFLSRDNQTGDEHYLMRQDKWHNEILVSNPKITAIFTDNLNDLPVEYLEKAQEENLPIVIVK